MSFLKAKRFWCLVFFIVLGVFRGMVWKPPLPPVPLDRKYHVCGTVAKPSELSLNGQKIILSDLFIDNQKTKGRLSVFLHKKSKRLYVGEQICFYSTIKSIRNFKTPGEFDFERYYAAQGIWGKCSVFSPPPSPSHKGRGNFIEKIRERFSLFLEKSKHASVLKALLLGIKNLPKDIEEDFIRSGLIHILVISGQNVGLLLIISFSFLCFLLSRFEFFLLYFNIQKIIIFVSFLLVGFFYFFSGAALPVLRASLMSSCFLFSLWNSKPQLGFYSLCWALAAILNFIPSSLLDPSFQLSFVSTAGLIALHSFNRKFFWLLSPIFITFITLPILLVHFHRISLISCFSNLIVLPFIGFIVLPTSLFMTALYFCSEFLASYLLVILNPFIELLLILVHIFASTPWNSLYFISPNILEIILWYGAIISFIFFRSLKIGFVLILILFFQFHVGTFLQKKASHLALSFLSVGQGDATFVQLPRGKTMLIDGGGMYGFSMGERVVAPYLWKKRVKKIDYLVLSHSDFDHSGGIPFVLEHFNIEEIWLSQWKSKTKIFYEILNLAEQKNIPCFLFSQKTAVQKIKNVEFIFLNPFNAFENKKINNLSLAFQLKYKDFSVLFTGDIEKEIEEKLVSYNIQSSILKVPHHGSKTSSSYHFLRKVSPELAVMSLGYQNRYGFPHLRVLQQYKKLNIPIWRTDQQGTLEIKTDGEGFDSVD